MVDFAAGSPAVNVFDALRVGRVVAGALRLGGRWGAAALVGFVVTVGYFVVGVAR